jgi:hypothetical protein
MNIVGILFLFLFSSFAFAQSTTAKLHIEIEQLIFREPEKLTK